MTSAHRSAAPLFFSPTRTSPPRQQGSSPHRKLAALNGGVERQVVAVDEDPKASPARRRVDAVYHHFVALKGAANHHHLLHVKRAHAATGHVELVEAVQRVLNRCVRARRCVRVGACVRVCVCVCVGVCVARQVAIGVNCKANDWRTPTHAKTRPYVGKGEGVVGKGGANRFEAGVCAHSGAGELGGKADAGAAHAVEDAVHSTAAGALGLAPGHADIDQTEVDVVGVIVPARRDAAADNHAFRADSSAVGHVDAEKVVRHLRRRLIIEEVKGAAVGVASTAADGPCPLKRRVCALEKKCACVRACACV